MLKVSKEKVNISSDSNGRTNFIECVDKRNKIANSLIILYTNARSIINKVDELNTIASCESPHLILITETWLKTNIPSSCIQVANYKIIRYDRKLKKGGGVCAYIHKSIYFTIITLENIPKKLELIAFSIKNYFYILVYIPPNLLKQEITEVINFLSETCDKYKNTFPDSKTVILGDFNQTDTLQLELDQDIANIIKEPTRDKSILDLCFTGKNNINELTYIMLHPLGKSDHNIIKIEIARNTEPSFVRKIKVHDLRKSIMNNTVIKLNDINWKPLYLITDVNDKVNYFYKKIYEIIETIPFKTVKLKNNDKPCSLYSSVLSMMTAVCGGNSSEISHRVSSS